MKNEDKLSVPKKILLAAYELEESGRRPFSAEDLVISAWRKFPDAFGLAGYCGDDGNLIYPDSNRVYAEIMGAKPIRKRGLLFKAGKKMYQLTESGRELARILLDRSNLSEVKKAGLTREVKKELKRLFYTKALEKYINRRISDITFHDACIFWGISPGSSANEFDGRIANFIGILGAAKDVIQEKVVTFEHGGNSYMADDLKTLFDVHHEMLTKFNGEIGIIRKRKDERKF